MLRPSIRASARALSHARCALRTCLVAALFATAWMAQPAGARDIFVTTTADGIANNGNCTLREAIKAANTNAAVDACAAGQTWPVDVVVLTDSVTPYRLDRRRAG